MVGEGGGGTFYEREIVVSMAEDMKFYFLRISSYSYLQM